MSQPPYPQPRYAGPPRTGRPHASYETHRDAEAAMAARRELGPEYEEDLAAGLADRMEQLVAYRTAELRHRGEAERRSESWEQAAARHRFVTAIVSLGAGVPITAIALGAGGLAEAVVCWAGIVGVNMAQALSGRRRSRS